MPRSAAPATRRAVITMAVTASALTGWVGAASASDSPLLYLREEPAVVIDQVLGGGTLRQAPLATNARWTPAETVGKVTGRELAGAGPERIAAILRAGWRQEGAEGFVAVDEVTPRQWTPTSAASLARALDSLGPDAQRVIFYAAPSFVERVGRADPRQALDGTLSGLIDAVSRGRATYLLAYRGDMSPLPPREMATHPTRWAARWPAGRGELRLMLGADGGAGQAELWARARSTPAGRDMLARGPGAYGLTSASAARDWLAQYRAFRGAPSVSVTGADYPVPVGGGLTLSAAGKGRVKVELSRAGNAVVTMQAVSGGKLRAIRKLTGPASGVVVRIPTDTRPGLYRVRAVLIGDGLRDRAALTVRVRK